MLASSVPANFPIPFANNAGGSYIRSIPQASQIGITNGAASLYDGFPPLCFTPVASGGVPPFGQDENGILYQITANIQWFEAGMVFPLWNSAFSAAIGGYPAGAVLASTTAGAYWRNTADNNTTNPDGGSPANWVNFFPQNITGNAGTATKLATPRNIVASGGATGTVAFDGSANVSLVLTLVTAAIESAIGFSTNFAATGHITFLGFTINWGPYSLSATAGSSQAVTFDSAFPTQGLHAWIAVDNSASQMIGYTGLTQSGMTVNKGVSDTNARTGTYFAIGN